MAAVSVPRPESAGPRRAIQDTVEQEAPPVSPAVPSMATQEKHPARSALRTMSQTIMPLLLSLPVILPIVQSWLDENRGTVVPESAYAVVLPAILALTALSGLLTRLMAVPAVNRWLAQWVPPLAPGEQ